VDCLAYQHYHLEQISLSITYFYEVKAHRHGKYISSVFHDNSCYCGSIIEEERKPKTLEQNSTKKSRHINPEHINTILYRKILYRANS
jgi:hypothetical protein